MHEHAVAGQVVAVAEDAVPVVDLPSVLDVLAELVGIRRLELAVGVLAGVEIDLLVVDGDLGGGRRMNGAREERRLQRDVHLHVDVRGRQRRNGHDRQREQRRIALLGDEADERARDFLAAPLAGRHVRQDRDRHDAHVERDDRRRNRRREPESEDDIDSSPPGDGPEQQVGPTEAQQPEHGNDGKDDGDLHFGAPSFAGVVGAGATPGAPAR